MRTNRTPASRAVIFSDRKSAGPIRNTVSPTVSTTSRTNGVGDLIARDAAAQSIDFELGFQERRALGSSTGPEYGSLSSFSSAKAVSEGASAMLSCTNQLARTRERLPGEQPRQG